VTRDSPLGRNVVSRSILRLPVPLALAPRTASPTFSTYSTRPEGIDSLHQYSYARIQWIVYLLLIIGCLMGPIALAEEEDSPDWTPPESEEWDWLHLNSGEWLKGEIKSLRDRKIKFDSDELDELSIDLSDCKDIYVNRLSFLRTESGDTPQGRGVLRGDLLEFETVDGRSLEIARADIISMVPGGDRELDYWSLLLGADYGMKDGNTDQVDLSGRVEINRRTATLRFLNSYRGVYGSQDNEKITNNHRATSSLDIFLTSRFYLTVPSIEYNKDEFKNLKHRVSTGGGVGYEFVRNQFMELDVSIGGAHQFQESEEGDKSDDFAGLAGVELDFDLPGGTELDNSYRTMIVATDMDKTSHHFESILSVDIWGPLDLDLTFMLDRIEKPEQETDGTRPEENDISVMAGMSIDF
jgi:putative salt-induced outer membrane protein YdiY